MLFVNKISPRNWFTIFLSGCILTSILLGAFAMRVAGVIKVDGPVVGLLVDSKDLLADILPPPHCLIEAYVKASQLMQATDSKEREEAIASVATLKDDYYASQKRWQTFRELQMSKGELNTGIDKESVVEMYDALLVKSHVPAEQFFQEFERRFVPAVRADDKELVQQVFETALKPAYEQHRLGIDEALKNAGQYSKAIEGVAVKQGKNFSTALSALLLTVILGFSGMGFYFYRLRNQSEKAAAELQRKLSAIDASAAEMQSKVNEILAVANKVAQRDYSQELTVRGTDAIGRLGEGLAAFFANKQETELQEQQRTGREREQAAELQRKVAIVLEIVNSVADGKFDVAIPQLGDDAIGQVATALQQAVNSMKSALGEVRDVSVTVSSAAEQLTAVSREITSGAQTQASSLEETASSLEEITSTVKQNTDNAQQARQLANGSRDVAERGGAVVSEAVQAMGEINQSSKKIADIITTIDEIAFQTNLLALNAAVEAARAGEQGRGFAVVAAEVRNLAQRSASAAKEIKALIQDSVRKVENGTDLVNKSGQTLSEIVSSVKRVTDIVSEIAAASKEQLTGIEQVNKAVSQMDRVTQANASQTEEMSGTATALLSHAMQLNDLVGRFQLDSETVQASRAAAAKKGASKSKRSNEPQARSTRPAPINYESTTNSSDPGVLEF